MAVLEIFGLFGYICLPCNETGSNHPVPVNEQAWIKTKK
ncbi:hypothetical protein NC99_42830 [Sunxiuqinia dokdonensis]|uniref:Uncharacterized protein n=1 Tax=Sunxiuqinia dokdonensis TaxID=1409788 RepID=A0A0L8V3B0_9BACT|nr:hypothetical protein NC99_42830 [Sunxiuqinia dokdonensis]